jgi:hypothetical protein
MAEYLSSEKPGQDRPRTEGVAQPNTRIRMGLQAVHHPYPPVAPIWVNVSKPD